ncbi:MAG: ATP-dependent DNA helicase RecG, partial [Flavobacteriales bacterium]
MNLNYPITYIEGISVQRAALLCTELGLKTCNDLLNFFPFRYIDKTTFHAIKDLQPNSSEVQIVGRITRVNSIAQKRGSRLVATFQDATGSIELVWFKGQKWLKDSLKVNEPYVVYGKLNHYNGSFSIPHPELELFSAHKKKLQTKMQPVYHATERLINAGVSNRIMGTYVQRLLEQFYDSIQENLSREILEDFKFMSKREALLNAHFPKSQEHLTKAENRLKFEELFFIQLQLLRKKLLNKTKIKGEVFEKVGTIFNDFYTNRLPFDLTNAQKRVLKEVRKDVASGAHMNRLLQGDVGSGKTIVAILAMLLAIDNGFQATIMAPTEILANQHFIAVSELVAGMGLKVAMLTGSVRTKKRREIHAGLEEGTLNILIGTHALLEDKVQFKNLGIAIIDEQHRFGVKQRAKLWAKNELPPHILVMTATPIPRTLAMSVYGDLDISVIDELPPGRKEVKTV